MTTFIHPAEILPARLYQRVRDRWLRSIIEHKRRRRVPLGDHASVLFESRETVLFQIHEILRVEGARTDERVRREIAEYEPLLPDGRSLTATVLIEGGGPERAGRTSLALARSPGALSLRVGDERIAAETIAPAIDPACPVHYMRFEAPAVAADLLDRAVPAELVLRSGSEIAVTPLPPPTRRELAATLGELIGELPIVWQLAWQQPTTSSSLSLSS